jgi:DNA invertase Pin-like site-specific DNA recombinase
LSASKASVNFWKDVALELRLSNGCDYGKSGGPLEEQSQQIFPTIEVAEIISYRHAKPYEDVSFLTDLYVKKGWSLRRISSELGCGKTTVRKILQKSGIDLIQDNRPSSPLKQKANELRNKGKSYQEIADIFNLWKISTSSGKGIWHGKTIRKIIGTV